MTDPNHKKTLIIAGGGTGGHVLAGVAIADAWRELGGERVLFVGSRGGIEEKLVPRAGYPLQLLSIGALNRASLSRRLKTMAQLPLSFLRSTGILLKERPQAVIGVGGYSSGPVVLLARVLGWLWGARTAILEQNAVPGFTNRVLSRFAHRVFVAFPGMEGAFSPERTRVTGNPVRNVLKPFPSAQRDPFTVFIFGGSQGARGINTLIIDALPHIEALQGRIRFIHQTGEADYQRVLDAHQKAGTGARVEKFIYDMPECYAAASLVVCRSGSSTLAEIAAVQRAAVLIPFPFASDNHQEKNARIFENAGAAKVMLQDQATGRDLADLINDLIAHPERIEQMERAAASLYRPTAAVDIVRSLDR